MGGVILAPKGYISWPIICRPTNRSKKVKPDRSDISKTGKIEPNKSPYFDHTNKGHLMDYRIAYFVNQIKIRGRKIKSNQAIPQSISDKEKDLIRSITPDANVLAQEVTRW
jgi:hypothetical protein